MCILHRVGTYILYSVDTKINFARRTIRVGNEFVRTQKCNNIIKMYALCVCDTRGVCSCSCSNGALCCYCFIYYCSIVIWLLLCCVRRTSTARVGKPPNSAVCALRRQGPTPQTRFRGEKIGSRGRAPHGLPQPRSQ